MKEGGLRTFTKLIMKCELFFSFFQNGGHLACTNLATTMARSDDHFIMEAPDRRSPLPPMKGRTVLYPCLIRDLKPVPLV